jgi:hypothetical protein
MERRSIHPAIAAAVVFVLAVCLIWTILHPSLLLP